MGIVFVLVLFAKWEEKTMEGKIRFKQCWGGRDDDGREVAGITSIGEECLDKCSLFLPLASHLFRSSMGALLVSLA